MALGPRRFLEVRQKLVWLDARSTAELPAVLPKVRAAQRQSVGKQFHGAKVRGGQEASASAQEVRSAPLSRRRTRAPTPGFGGKTEKQRGPAAPTRRKGWRSRVLGAEERAKHSIHQRLDGS